MHAQIVADALGVPFDRVDVHEVDTAAVPDSGPTVASRTCMIVGRLLERCARQMRRASAPSTPAQYYRRHGAFTISDATRRRPGAWDDARYRGDAYGSFGCTCNVVELDVDPVTGEVTPPHVTAVAEIGRAIHPQMAEGQIVGGTVQGLGWALIEDVVMRDGRMANAQLTNYVIPDADGRAADRRRAARAAVRARPVRRQGRRRDADRQPGAGRRQRPAARRLRPAGDPGDTGAGAASRVMMRLP